MNNDELETTIRTEVVPADLNAQMTKENKDTKYQPIYDATYNHEIEGNTVGVKPIETDAVYDPNWLTSEDEKIKFYSNLAVSDAKSNIQAHEVVANQPHIDVPENEEVEVTITDSNGTTKFTMNQLADQMVEQMAQGVDVLGEGEMTNTSSKQKGYSTAVILATIASILSIVLIILGTFIIYK